MGLLQLAKFGNKPCALDLLLSRTCAVILVVFHAKLGERRKHRGFVRSTCKLLRGCVLCVLLGPLKSYKESTYTEQLKNFCSNTFQLTDLQRLTVWFILHLFGSVRKNTFWKFPSKGHWNICTYWHHSQCGFSNLRTVWLIWRSHLNTLHFPKRIPFTFVAPILITGIFLNILNDFQLLFSLTAWTISFIWKLCYPCKLIVA